jgi:ferredoxin
MDHRHPASLVEYRSAGELLIIDQFRSLGDQDRALELAKQLSEPLRCTVFIGGLAPTGATERVDGDLAAKGIKLAVGRMAALTGHLGQFEATIGTGDGEVNLARHLGRGRQHFDLVLDLSTPPHFRQDVAPLGYYAPQENAQALERALAELPDMVGEFEKAKFFNYDPDICAHGSSGLTGCTRCIAACPTQAITSIGEKIEVNPYLCQGAGSCATACPTGAITYAYPAASDLQNAIRALLRNYREAGGREPCLLFHDAENGRQLLERIAPQLPEHVIPLEVEEIGCVGLDTCLAALAYGAGDVVLVATATVAPSVRGEIAMQLEFGAAILEGMGYPRERLQLLSAEDDNVVLETLTALPSQLGQPAAGFAGLDEKRTVIRLAVDHLYRHAPVKVSLVELPAGAPFGEIRVDRQGCTLCMACVSVCPHSALSAGGELPQLLFDEQNCVQCGLCATACPEKVIELEPRYVYEPELRQATRILNEEEPFCCVACGKPFSTQSMMNKMQEKLKGHWMFQKPDALRRLQMCEDCRVKDMFTHEEGGIDVYTGPKR